MIRSRLVRTATTWMRTDAGYNHAIGRRDSQLLHGESLTITPPLYRHWADAACMQDNYHGWVDVKDLKLATPRNQPTHVIIARMANLYHTPNFKNRPGLSLSFMAQVRANPADTIDGFVSIPDEQDPLWIPENQIMARADLTANPADIVDTAMMFLHSPYLYGGRHANGIDCSALVQLALQRNGLFCPRDTDMQEDVIGDAVQIDLANLERGDIVYFPGHVGIMVDDKNIINANVRFMQVVIEPLDDAIKIYNTITAVRRLPDVSVNPSANPGQNPSGCHPAPP